jgi:release factor glutamine methyltransferase
VAEAKSEIALPLAQKAAQLLAERGIENARLEAELLLAHVLGIKRLDLYLQFDRPLTAAQLEHFRQVVRRRLKREPLQYITGRAQFRSLNLAIDPRALIPRPETEVLVSVVLEYVRAQGRALRLIDIGTGSGAIALSIAKEAPNVSVQATDISSAAAALAGENAAEIGIELPVWTGSLFDPVPEGEQFDIVVSNPPYIAESERPQLQPEVREWEPASALFAGTDGLDVVRALVAAAPARMTVGGLLALEIGSTQAREVESMMNVSSSFEEIRVIRDLSGRERIVTAVRRRDHT